VVEAEVEEEEEERQGERARRTMERSEVKNHECLGA
jgi:hypothetical protein